MNASKLLLRTSRTAVSCASHNLNLRRNIAGAALNASVSTPPPPPPPLDFSTAPRASSVGKEASSAACEPCASSPLPSMAELDIDTTSDIRNTRPNYSEHILVHTGRGSWPSRIEMDPSSRVGELKALYRKKVEEEMVRTGAGLYPVSITNTSLPSPEYSISFSVLPSGWTYTFPTCTPTSEIFRALSLPRSSRLPSDCIGAVRTLLTTPVILVCGHHERDSRCGILGPKIVEAFKKADPKAEVALTSHVGGHKWAGNVIVYNRKDGKWMGDWYGRVRPEDVPQIVETIKYGGIWKPEYAWRGRKEW